jgi:hypothetical protein
LGLDLGQPPRPERTRNAARRGRERSFLPTAVDGQQPGDPDKLAQALLTIVDEDQPPRRFIAGADVIALAQRKIDELREQIESHRELSTSLSFDPETGVR